MVVGAVVRKPIDASSPALRPYAIEEYLEESNDPKLSPELTLTTVLIYDPGWKLVPLLVPCTKVTSIPFTETTLVADSDISNN